VLEGVLVRVQKLREPFVRTRLVVAAAAEAQRQHENVAHGGRVAEGDAGLAPVELALLPRRGLEAHERTLGLLARRAQRLHEELHRVVAARVVAPLAQDACRVLDPGGLLRRACAAKCVVHVCRDAARTGGRRARSVGAMALGRVLLGVAAFWTQLVAIRAAASEAPA
jgi:hypothetical protein